MKIVNDFCIPVPAQMFLRDQGDGKAMLLCVLDSDAVPDNIPEVGAFILGEISVHPNEIFDPGESVSGYRADQILCQSWDLQRMDKIEPKAGL